MSKKFLSNGPVVIGGVGGSGTRVVAEILSYLGFYIGRDLNHAKDNLSYTLLFKRAKWLYHNMNSEKKIFLGLDVLTKSMVGKGSFNLQEYYYILNAFLSMSLYRQNKFGTERGKWAWNRMIKIFQKSNYDRSAYIGWGWKEPNSYLLVHYFNQYFKDLKYIHTIRHGLDMAFSWNQQQLFNWAGIYGILPPNLKKDVPRASLSYWVAANQKVIKTGKELGPEKFLLLNYDQLCLHPEKEIQKICEFLDVRPSLDQLNELVSIPTVPKSKGRYKSHNLNQFDKNDIDYVKELGFEV